MDRGAMRYQSGSDEVLIEERRGIDRGATRFGSRSSEIWIEEQ